MNTDIETKMNNRFVNDAFGNSQTITRRASNMSENSKKPSDESRDDELSNLFERADWPMALALYEHRNPGHVMVDIHLESANIVDAMPRINGRSICMDSGIEKKENNPAINDDFVNTKPLTKTVLNTNEIAIDSLNNHDELKLNTGRSEYRFMLTDPDNQRGLLTGGQLGEELAEANILAVRDDDGFHLIDESSRIGVGMRIIFHIPSGVRNLVTSPITKLVLIKNES